MEWPHGQRFWAVDIFLHNVGEKIDIQTGKQREVKTESSKAGRETRRYADTQTDRHVCMHGR